MDKVSEFRRQIDTLDDKILELLKARVKIAQEIYQQKKIANSDFDSPGREHEILARLSANPAASLISAADIQAIYSEIIRVTRANASSLV